MGRRPKFSIGDEAEWDGQPVVIVDYRRPKPTTSEYQVVRVAWETGPAMGPAKWLMSHELSKTGKRRRRKVVRTVRENAALGDRGCLCQCCVHEAWDHA